MLFLQHVRFCLGVVHENSLLILTGSLLTSHSLGRSHGNRLGMLSTPISFYTRRDCIHLTCTHLNAMYICPYLSYNLWYIAVFVLKLCLSLVNPLLLFAVWFYLCFTHAFCIYILFPLITERTVYLVYSGVKTFIYVFLCHTYSMKYYVLSLFDAYILYMFSFAQGTTILVFQMKPP